MTDESFVEIQQQANKLINKRKGVTSDKNNNAGKIDTIAEEDKSDVEESPSPKANVEKQKGNNKK